MIYKELLELNFFGSEPLFLDMLLFAVLAFIAEVRLLGGLLARHLEFGDSRLGIPPQIALAAR